MKRLLFCLLSVLVMRQVVEADEPATSAAPKTAGPALKIVSYKGHITALEGKPVQARAFRSNGWSPDGTTWTEVTVNADGTFEFEAQAQPRGLDFAATAPGFAITGLPLKSGIDNTVVMEKPRNISGVLRDEKGRPVAGVAVSAAYFYIQGRQRDDDSSFVTGIPEPLRAQFSGRSGAEGKWSIDALPAAAYVQVELRDPKYVLAATQISPDQDASDSPEPPLRAIRAGSILGRIVDKDGGPVGKTFIYAVSAAQKRPYDMGGIAFTDATGNFRLDSLKPDTYSIVVPFGAARGMPRFYRGAPVEPATSGVPVRLAQAVSGIVVAAGDVKKINDIPVTPAAFLTGTVLHSRTGKPVAGASVSAWSAAIPRSGAPLELASTDANGHFEIYVAPGPVALFAYKSDWGLPALPDASEEMRFDLKPGSVTPATIRILPKVETVTGTIVDEAGVAQGGVTLTMGRDAGYGRYIKSDAAGSFRADMIPTGDVVINGPSGRAVMYDVVSPKKVTVPLPDGQLLRIVVRRKKLEQISGLVLTEGGAPIADAALLYKVIFKANDGKMVWSPRKATTDAEGRFNLPQERLDSSVELQRATKNGLRLLRGGEVTVENGAFKVADIVMEKLARSLRGTVRDTAGAPVAGAVVRSSADNFEVTVQSDTEGHFTLANLPATAVTLIAAQGHRWARTEEKDGVVTLRESPAFQVDTGRATEIIEESIDAGIDRPSLEESALKLAPYDPDAAYDLFQRAQARPTDRETKVLTNDEMRASLIRAIARRAARMPEGQPALDALGWAQSQVPLIKGDGEIVRSACLLGLALAGRDRPAANSLLKTAAAHAAGASKRDLTLIAALAARLDAPEADAFLSNALKEAPNDGDRAYAAAFRNFFKRGTPDSDLTLGTIARPHVLSALSSVIQEGAPFSQAGALAALARMKDVIDDIPEQAENEQGRAQGRAVWESTFAQATRRVIDGLGDGDGALATRLAADVDDKWNGVAVRASAAAVGTPAERIAQAHAALEFESRGPWMRSNSASRLGAILTAVDATEARALFAESIEMRARVRSEGRDQTGVVAETSFYSAVLDPATARLSLEAAWAQPQPAPDKTDKYDMAGWSRSTLSIAMAALDVDRAVQMARTLSTDRQKLNPSPRARALSEIGQLLLVPAALHWRFSLSAETGFDVE